MMHTKIFTLIMLLLMLFGLTGLPTDIFALLVSSIIASIAYLFAIKLNLIPSKIYLNYYSMLYFIWLIKEILLSSLGVMKIIWRKNLNLQPVFEWVDSKQKNDTSLVIYANSITLTPGTVTLDIVNSGGFGARNDGATPICNRRATSDDVTNFSSINYISNSMLLVHALEQSSIDNLKFSSLEFGGSTMSKRVRRCTQNVIARKLL